MKVDGAETVKTVNRILRRMSQRHCTVTVTLKTAGFVKDGTEKRSVSSTGIIDFFSRGGLFMLESIFVLLGTLSIFENSFFSLPFLVVGPQNVCDRKGRQLYPQQAPSLLGALYFIITCTWKIML